MRYRQFWDAMLTFFFYDIFLSHLESSGRAIFFLKGKAVWPIQFRRPGLSLFFSRQRNKETKEKRERDATDAHFNRVRWAKGKKPKHECGVCGRVRACGKKKGKGDFGLGCLDSRMFLFFFLRTNSYRDDRSGEGMMACCAAAAVAAHALTPWQSFYSRNRRRSTRRSWAATR